MTSFPSDIASVYLALEGKQLDESRGGLDTLKGNGHSCVPSHLEIIRGIIEVAYRSIPFIPTLRIDSQVAQAGYVADVVIGHT
jgi:hypothetical protein